MLIPKLAAPGNRGFLLRLLNQLDAGCRPLWGKMRAQQMLEHLIDQVQYTNGSKIPFCDVAADEALRRKARMLAEDVEIPRNVILGDLPEAHAFPGLHEATQQLMLELDRFDQFLAKPGSTAIHGTYGPMNHAEWVIWHSRHFRHHLKQFGLLPPDAF